MTTAYIPSDKYVNTLRFERSCEHCAHVVTSLRRDGLSRAYRKHLQAHHPAIFHETGRKFRQYPANSTPPELPEPVPVVRPSITCPYCPKVFTSTTQARVERILTNHKRVDHTHQYADEVAARVACTLDAVEAEELVEVRVKETYYPRAFLVTRYPKLTTVMVPARWRVDAVYVLCDGTGKYTAYRGQMGSSESWGVGK